MCFRRQLVQSDLDGSVKGKQWPLSGYGPFRDRPSVPNFIVDQSFEEIRLLCYESKTQGTFSTVAAQINQQIIDAKARTSMLHDFGGDAQNIIVNLRGIGEDNDLSTQNNNFNSNPFAINAPNVATTNQSTNLFRTGPSIPASNPFATGNGGGGSIFGSTSKGFDNAPGSLFNSSSSFGGISGGGGSIFGGGFSSTTGSPFQSAAASPFSLSQIGKPVDQQPLTGSSIFGVTPTQTNPIFGGTASFGCNTASIFSQQQQVAGASSNIFGHSQQTNIQQPQQSNFFGVENAATTADQNIFGVGVVDTAGVTTNQSIFGSAQENIFGNQQTQSQNVFGGQTQTAFGAVANQQPQPADVASGIFGAAVSQQSSTAGFGFQSETAQTTVQSQLSFATTNQPQQSTFGTNTANVFQAQPQQQSSSQSVEVGSPLTSVDAESTVYSKIENLSTENLERFKANTFELGKIPTVPPPRGLCV